MYAVVVWVDHAVVARYLVEFTLLKTLCTIGKLSLKYKAWTLFTLLTYYPIEWVSMFKGGFFYFRYPPLVIFPRLVLFELF